MFENNIFHLIYNFHVCTVELKWLKHLELVCHDYFELVPESLTKNPIAAYIIVFWITSGDFLFSSPEHEVLMVSYCDQSLSVVRACQLFALYDFSSKTA